ncbi:MAG: CDP-diacylglycerol--serine O-phosphatidyltransferase [Bdellovibrionales bacterium]|nr:CDP-diacylglycerol--serine O-phosphatidyltransferase [Bdellovibrionales bacterium]
MKTLKNARFAIPNSVTTANVICGFLSILASMENQFTFSAWLIICAGIFDLFDGRLARLLNASSRFGEEFDTLSDFLSFGVAPAILFYQLFFRSEGTIGAVLSIVYLLCVAFRLARFSVNLGSPSTGFFQGLSSPVAACVAASFVLFYSSGVDTSLIPIRIEREFATALVLGLAFLMVSSLRFPSFKNTKWKSPRGVVILGALVCLLLLAVTNPKLYVFPILMGLLMVVILADMTHRLRGTFSASRN